MESTHINGHPEGHAKPSESRAKWVFVAFTAIAAFFLFTEHRAHLFGVLPFLFLLACPLLHMFHHGMRGGGHDNHGGEAQGKPEGDRK
jgi:hypothetical protein